MHRSAHRLLALLGLALAPLPTATRAQDASECLDLSGLPITPQVRWPQVWQALHEEASCTQNCHSGSLPTAELDFSSSALSIYFLVGQLSAQNDRVFRVVPGAPESSLLFQKINCQQPAVGTPMPPPAGQLSVELQGLIYDWIAQGAYGESAEDPIPREFILRDSFESLRNPIPIAERVNEANCYASPSPRRGLCP